MRAWKPLADRGLASLTANALEGVRKMPPHGGRLDLSDLEIERAITYMVNQSGGRWTEPTDRATRVKARTGEEIVQALIEIPKKLKREQQDLLRKFAETEDKSVMPESKGFFERMKGYFTGSPEASE